MTVGLTGGSGTGKSSAARIFAEKNFVVIDFDKLSRKVCEKGSACLSELCGYFGNSIMADDGSLIRKKLGEIVFSDSAKLGILNKITHKYILEEAEKIMAENRDKKILLDAPLLFEAELDKKCDFVVSVTAPADKRARRIERRDGISAESAKKRIQSQKSDEYYTSRSDFVIRNDGDISQLERRTYEIIDEIIRENRKRGKTNNYDIY